MMEAGDTGQYYIFDNRLASFEGPRLAAKRRLSTVAGSRATKAQIWPHKSPAPIDLARAGFFFNPQPSNPDNVRCFLCHKDLDGWEHDDDPLQEHLKHSSSCGWAICAAIELELGDVVNEDPRLPYLLDARKSTFADRWPHEGKKGWKCTTKQLADAGWKYTPTIESEDNTTCAYCQLALDGWEAGDKPMNEHQRRSPNCLFFTLLAQNPPPKKTARSKSNRTSKATRLSVQSTATIQSDALSLADPDESVLTVATVVTAGGKKPAASRSRKTATSTAKGRKPRAKKDEKLSITRPSVDTTSAVEGEAAITENQAPTSTPPTRGKKRASEEAGPWNSSEEVAHVAKKKRTTRVRASSSSTQAKASNYAMFDPASPASDETAIEAELRALERDMEVGDESQLQEQLEREQEQKKEFQTLKKGRKTGVRKVSKQTGKTKETSSFIATKPEGQPIASERVPETATTLPQPAEDFAVKPGAAQEIQQQKLPSPESIASVKSKANSKPKSKPKTKKMSLPPREPSKPRLSLQELEDLEGPDELHEDSFVSANSTNMVTWEDAGSGNSAAIAPPVKKGRGRSLQKLADSARSNASSDAAEASAQPAAVAEITTMAVDLSAPKRRQSNGSIDKLEAIEKNARRSQTNDKTSNSSTKTKQPHASRAPNMPVSAAPVPLLTRTTSTAPTTPRKQQAHIVSAKQGTLSPSQSPQSSDAENRPPSSRPASTSADKGQRVALASMRIPTALAAPSTPGGFSTYVRPGSPSKRPNTIGGLRSAIPWSAVDVDAIFDIDKENGDDILGQLLRKGTDLSTPEKAMTVEGFILHNAGQAERMLKEGCEAMVSVFEQQGTEAMRVLESLEVEE